MFNENFDQWYKTKNPFTSSNEWSKQITEICHICQHMTQKNLNSAPSPPAIFLPAFELFGQLPRSPFRQKNK